MGVSFAGFSWFDSGPHRVVLSSVGREFLFPGQGDNFLGTIDVRGIREPLVLQRGRLVASTDSALWSQVDTIRIQSELPRFGNLVEPSGRVWPSLTMLRFRLADRVDRGRVVSVGYEVTYAELRP